MPSYRSSSGTVKRVEKEREKALPSGRGSGSGPKRSHTTPDSEQERQLALQTTKDFLGGGPNSTSSSSSFPAYQPSVPAHAKPVSQKPPVEAMDEDTLSRKTHTIVDELTQNKDYKVY